MQWARQYGKNQEGCARMADIWKTAQVMGALVLRQSSDVFKFQLHKDDINKHGNSGGGGT